MNRFYFFLLALVAFACNDKEDITPPPPSHPVMKYTELNTEVKFGEPKAINLDDVSDLDFLCYVLPIGDPLLRQDKDRFLAGSFEHSLLFVDGENESPILDKGTEIKSANKLPHEWWEVSEVYLGQKVTEENNSTHWEGNWKNVNHKYLSIQVKRGTRRYNGWVELSFDVTNEKVIIHKTGISTEAEKTVKAGF